MTYLTDLEDQVTRLTQEHARLSRLINNVGPCPACHKDSATAVRSSDEYGVRFKCGDCGFTAGQRFWPNNLDHAAVVRQADKNLGNLGAAATPVQH